MEVNAVICVPAVLHHPWRLRSNVTVPLPSEDAAPAEETASSDEEAPIFVTGTESIDQMINTLGCPLCHTIPGIEGAVGDAWTQVA